MSPAKRRSGRRSNDAARLLQGSISPAHNRMARSWCCPQSRKVGDSARLPSPRTMVPRFMRKPGSAPALRPDNQGTGDHAAACVGPGSAFDDDGAAPHEVAGAVARAATDNN